MNSLLPFTGQPRENAAERGEKWLLPYWLGVAPAGRVEMLGRDALWLLLIVCVWYFGAYVSNDSVPNANSPGWRVWWDQGQYYKQTIELAHGELQPNVYWLGYPLLGAPFYWLLPLHPYLIPNLAMVLTMVACYYAACRLFVSRLEGLVLISVFILVDPLVRDECLIVPWNTLPAYTAFFLSIYLLVLRPGRRRDFALCAVMSGLAMLARPTEILGLGLVYAFGLGCLSNWKERFWAIGFLGIAGLGATAALLGLNLHLYHQLHSPYMEGEAGKMVLQNYGLKLYQFVFDSRFLTGDAALPPGTPTLSLLGRYPEFFLVLPGFIFLLRNRGWTAWGMILGLAYPVAFYLTYSPFNNAPYAWTYGSWHYIAWIIPWLGLVAYLSLRRAFFALPFRLFLAALLLPALLACLIGFQAVPRAWANNHSGDGMRLETRETAGIQAVKIAVEKPVKIENIRFAFQQPLPLNGTDNSNRSDFTISINGRPQCGMVDFQVSQENENDDFSFLDKGLSLRAGDVIEATFQIPKAPPLERVELLGVSYAPLTAIRHYFFWP